MNDEEFLAQLRTEVVAADERHRASTGPSSATRSARVRWLGAAAVLLLVAGVVVALRPPAASAGVEVVADADGLTIRLTDLTTRPEAVERAARDAGLDVTVTAEPVGPSQVGRFIGLTASGGTSQIQVTEGDAESGFTAIRLPRQFDDSLHLQIGRAPEPGEEWAVSSDATAIGEPLECEDLLGRPLPPTLEAIERAGIGDVRVNLMDEGRWLPDAEVDDHLDAIVRWVANTSDDEVQVFITRDPNPPATTPTTPPGAC